MVEDGLRVLPGRIRGESFGASAVRADVGIAAVAVGASQAHGAGGVHGGAVGGGVAGQAAGGFAVGFGLGLQQEDIWCARASETCDRGFEVEECEGLTR